jgi:type IV pilus assembly protein PilM
MRALRKTETYNGLVGVDIGSTSVKLVELSGVPQSPTLENISVIAVPDEASSSAYERALRLLLEGKELATTRIATSVSGRKVAVRGMRFPALAKNELQGAIRFEGSQVIAFDLDEAYLDHTVVSTAENGSGMDILFVAVRKEEVDAKLSVLESAGLEPRVVGVDALVLLDVLLGESDSPETCGVVDIGASNTSIGIGREGGIPFVRDVEIGGNDYTEAIAKALDVPLDDAEKVKVMEPERELASMRAIEDVTRRLVQELCRSLMYYQTRGNGAQVDRLYLCGGSAGVPGIVEALTEAAGIEVQSWSPLDRVEVNESRFDMEAVRRLASVSSLAAALAMKPDPN